MTTRKFNLSGQTGPRHPEPFPNDGDLVKLLTCPVCKNKGVPLFFAPTEEAYPTACQKCGAQHVIHPKDHDFSEGAPRGHGPQLDGYTKPAYPERVGASKVDGRALDATEWWQDLLDRRDLGKTWWKR